MKSNLIAASVVAVAALTSLGASAQTTFNSYLFDQMAAPSTKTRAEVKAEVLQGQAGTASASSFNGATAQQAQTAPRADKTSATPQAAAADFVKTSQ